MKRSTRITKAAICICVLLSASHLSAQTSIGIKVGANFGKMDFEGESISDGFTKSSNVGINLGIPFEIRFNKVFAIQPEINYMTKGVQFNFSESWSDGTSWEKSDLKLNEKLSYVEIPFMLKVGLNKEKFGINFLAGPSIGYLTKIVVAIEGSYSNSNGESENISESVSLKAGSQDFFTVIDLGVNAGVEASYHLGAGVLFAEARYQVCAAINTDGMFINKGVQTVIGYRLPFSAFKKTK